MSSTDMKTEVIECFLEHCQSSVQMPLGFLQADADVRNSPSESAMVVKALTEKFTTENLIECGIVHVENDATVVLTPALHNGASFVVLRDAATQRPYELLTHAGCLAAKALPVLEVLRDGRTRRLVEEGTGDLVVAFDLEHVIMLRACGLPATLAVGFDDFPLEEIDRFCKSFDLSWSQSDREISRDKAGEDHGHESEYHPNDPMQRLSQNMTTGGTAGSVSPFVPGFSEQVSTSAAPIEVRLVFLGWTPLELANAVSLQLKPIVDHLRQLQRFLNLDIDTIGLWEVEEEVIERLRFIADRRNAVIFKEAMLDAVEMNIDSIAYFGKEKPSPIGPVNDYAAALTRLLECSWAEAGHRLADPDARDDAWRDVQRLLSQQLIDPVRELALAIEDPVERNLLMGLAELSNVFHRQSVAMSEQLHCRISARGVEQGRELPAGQFKNLMATADRLIEMAKAREQCSQIRTTILEPRRIASRNFPRLPHSG